MVLVTRGRADGQGTNSERVPMRCGRRRDVNLIAPSGRDCPDRTRQRPDRERVGDNHHHQRDVERDDGSVQYELRHGRAALAVVVDVGRVDQAGNSQRGADSDRHEPDTGDLGADEERRLGASVAQREVQCAVAVDGDRRHVPYRRRA